MKHNFTNKVAFKFFMKTTLFLLTLAISSISQAQTGGDYAFPFMDLTYNARSAGLSGDFICARDGDINLGVANPSMLNERMHTAFGFNQALLSGKINYGMAAYGYNWPKAGSMSTYIQYVNYGKFTRTAINGTEEGSFHPFEMVIGGGIGRSINPHMSVGANLKFIYSDLESYRSFGAGIDLAASYFNEEKGIVATALFKNAGIQFNAYHENGEQSPLPAELQAAVAYKLPHAPFRFTLLVHHLNKWDITYQDPNLKPTIDPLSGDTIPVPTAGFMEKLGRHFTYQLETIVTKNIHIRAGFDYQRRKEMRLEQRPGIAGFSFGLGLYFNKFSLDYGFMVYSTAGFNQMLTLSTNFSKWRK